MPDLATLAERAWFGADRGARAMRSALAPASLLYGGIVRTRAMLYDAGTLASHRLPIPSLSIGNLTVGGTGKTPIAAWFAARLRDGGARPAIVLRGYGDDEPLVHAVLAPGVDVVVDADRVRGVAEAARRGADVAVLDDAFQHRRARRDVDVVLVAAEQADAPVRLLPAGPYREPLDALRRASLVIVTRKSADDGAVHRAFARIARAAPHVERVSVALVLDALHRWTMEVHGSRADDDARAALSTLHGERVLAVAAIGAPAAFFAQLVRLGARVEQASFADHHAFTPSDVATLASRAATMDRVVCTLKDAVKLGPSWPRLARPLWYVSQRVTPQWNGASLDQLVVRLLSMRDHRIEPAGVVRPS